MWAMGKSFNAACFFAVKVAISCGVSHFALIGDAAHSHYVVLGQPVWDIKVAENLAVAGDVIASPSAWRHANEAEYISESFGDGTHTRVKYCWYSRL
ncbi:adenylate cyclase type 10-like [Cydia fagiglandana]|uniref:adenylate cyclase type 10-like n=1 Tax=Cydia fagiglandana TaxID=1458189 RepID=UPI002FEE183F